MTTCHTSLFFRRFSALHGRYTALHERYTGVLQSNYGSLQSDYSNPGPGHGRERPEQGAKRTQGIRVHVAAGRHEHTEIGGRGRRQGCTAHNLDKLAGHRAPAQARQSRVLLPRA